jgi:GNAT superfamily N-acetyltransferase
MINIRKAVIKDIPAIVDFQLKMAMETESKELDQAIVQKGVEAVFNDETKGQYIVAATENRVVASLMLTSEWSDWRNAKVLWFQSVYVISDYRKRGIFAKMYAFVKALVLESDQYMGLRLYVEKDNIPAQSVYQKMGMDGEHYKMFEWMKS